MFNLAQYEERVQERMKEIRAAGRGAPANCSRSYASHLLKISRGRLDRIGTAGHWSKKIQEGMDVAEYTPHATAELRDIAGVIYNAANLFAGTVIISDWVRSVAEMELYAEANTPTVGQLETDEDFRLRILQRAKDIGAAEKTLDMIRVSAIDMLEHFGNCYGLERMNKSMAIMASARD